MISCMASVTGRVVAALAIFRMRLQGLFCETRDHSLCSEPSSFIGSNCRYGGYLADNLTAESIMGFGILLGKAALS